MPPGRAGSAKLGGVPSRCPRGGARQSPPAPAVPPGRARGHKAALWAQISHSSLSLFFLIGLIGRISPQAGCALSRGVTLPCTPPFSRAHGHAREQTTSPACPHAFGKGRASASN